VHNAKCTCWNCPAINLAGKVDFRACGQSTKEFEKQTDATLETHIMAECKRRPGLGLFDPMGIKFEECPEWRKTPYGYLLKDMRVMILGMDVASTSKSDLQDCGHLVRFFESTNFNEMSPHDELKYGDTRYVLALPGTSYIAYTPSLKGKIGLKNTTAGNYEFHWFDCATGKQFLQTEVAVAMGDQTWIKPVGMGNEVAVYIKRIKE